MKAKKPHSIIAMIVVIITVVVNQYLLDLPKFIIGFVGVTALLVWIFEKERKKTELPDFKLIPPPPEKPAFILKAEDAAKIAKENKDSTFHELIKLILNTSQRGQTSVTVRYKVDENTRHQLKMFGYKLPPQQGNATLITWE